MIRYFCDFTDRALTPEQIGKCQQIGAQFCSEQGLPANNPVTREFFDASVEPHVKDYWLEKIKVLQELQELWDSRLTNHRKDFCRKKGLFGRPKAVK